MTIPISLIQQLASGRIVPFVGSGVSLAVKRDLFPTWGRLLELLAERLHGDAKEDSAEIVRRFVRKGQLNKAADEAFDELGLARFREVMTRTFAIDRPSDVDLALPDALWGLCPKLVVTTNYDRVLQWSNSAVRQVTNSQQGNLADLFATSAPDKPFVWHLHGHIDDPNSLILAPQQYERLYHDAKDDKHPFAAAWLQLRTLIGNYPLLFVGFGMQDEYVMDALGTVLGIFGGNLRSSFALLKVGDDRARAFWDKHKIQVIEYSDHGRPLVELLAEIALQKNAMTSEGHIEAAGPTVIPPAYVTWLTEQCADITPFGMAPAQGQSVCLQQVYVPLTSRRFDDAKPQLLLEQLSGRSLYVSGDPGSGKSTFCRWVAWLIATGEIPEFEVAASYGFREELPEILRNRLPVLVRLREFREFLPALPGRNSLTAAEFLLALKTWLERKRPGGLRWSDVEPNLAGGSLLLILDGIDELPLTDGEGAAAWSPRESLLAGVTATAAEYWNSVSEELKAKAAAVKKKIEELKKKAEELKKKGEDRKRTTTKERERAERVLKDVEGELKRAEEEQGTLKEEQKKFDNRYLLTSRPYGLTVDQVRQLERVGLTEARIDPLPESLQNLLAVRWFVALPKSSTDGRQIASAMLNQVRGLAGDVAVLATNPLLLTAICIIYGEGKQLPQDKHNLYDRIVNTALHSRYARGPNVVAPVRARLAVIALGMHTGEPHHLPRNSPVAEISYTELDQILGAYIGATPETESGFRRPVDAREELLTHSGLLSQRETARASFYHMSFQEFLAAERLVLLNPYEDKLQEVFRQRAEQSGWRSTLSFLFANRVAQPGWQAGVNLLEKLMAVIDTTNVAESLGLVRSIVDAFDILLNRDLKLQTPLITRFYEIWLAVIAQKIDLKTRVELVRIMGHIGASRVADDLSNSSAWVTVGAGMYLYGDDKELFAIDRSFMLSKYPVTNRHFARFLEAGGYANRSLWLDDGWTWRKENNIIEPKYWHVAKWNGATQPVVGVSWWEADAFCRWSNCRLPTEREWEAAARGSHGSSYPWGDKWYDGICNSGEIELSVTTPVGIFSRSSAICGAEDMAGNVWEWCADWYDPEKRGYGRALRGGAWNRNALNCRSANRNFYQPSDRDRYCGFRVART